MGPNMTEVFIYGVYKGTLKNARVLSQSENRVVVERAGSAFRYRTHIPRDEAHFTPREAVLWEISRLEREVALAKRQLHERQSELGQAEALLKEYPLAE